MPVDSRPRSTATRAITQAWLATLLVLVAVTRPALAAPPDANTLRPPLEQLLATRVPAAGPGVVVLVARRDAVLFRGARGMASIELGVPMTPEHVLRIGSVTKQFAAATLLKLVDEGRAQLADPLSKYLPAFPNGNQITLAQLLNHTSGVKTYTGIPGYIAGPARRDLSTAELVSEIGRLPVDFAPGATYAYNNSSYVLVGAVIEAITRRPWHAQVAMLLQPLGITHTTWDDPGVVIPGMAQGYSINARGLPARPLMLSMTQPHAAGALVSSADDLWRWNLALHNGQVLSAEGYRRMTTPEGAAAQGRGYGYGLMAGLLGGQAVLWHNGGIPGFTSALIWLPQDQLTVVVLRNSDSPEINPAQLAREIAALALGPR